MSKSSNTQIPIIYTNQCNGPFNLMRKIKGNVTQR